MMRYIKFYYIYASINIIMYSKIKSIKLWLSSSIMIIYVIVIVIEQIKFHFDNASKASNCRIILIFFDKVK